MPVGVEGGAVDLVQAGRQRRADLDVGGLAGRFVDPHRRVAAVEPAGTIAVSSCGEAFASRAGRPPIEHARQQGSTAKPVPAMVTCPPSTAQSGRTAEMRDELEDVIVNTPGTLR